MLISSLVLLCLLGYCLGLTRLKKWPIEYTPLFSISILVTSLYFFAYFNQLGLGVYIMMGIGATLLLTSPFYLPKNKNQIISHYLTPGFTFWIALSIVLSIYAAHTWIHNWDDFGEWGPHAKAMFYNTGFVRASDYGINKDFPPGPGLFYFSFIFFNNLSDSVIKFAQNFLCMAPIAILFAKGKWNQWKFILSAQAIILIVFVLIHTFHVGFNIKLATDDTIGVFFGCMLFTYYRNRSKGINAFYLLPIIFAFSLLKPKLYIFVLLLCALIIADQIYQRYFLKQKTPLELTPQLIKSLFLLLACLLATLTWRHYVIQAHIARSNQLHITAAKIIELLSDNISAYHKAILIKFISYKTKVLLDLLPFVLLTIVYCLFSKQKQQKNTFLVWQISLLIGFIFYLLGILLMGLFGFHSTMELGWAVVRYYTIYLIGWSLFVWGNLYEITLDRFVATPKTLINYMAPLCSTSLLALLIVWGIKIHHQAIHRPDFARIAAIAVKINQSTPPHTTIKIQKGQFTVDEENQLAYQILPRRIAPP